MQPLSCLPLIAAITLFSAGPIVAGTLEGSTVGICEDSGEWPPYTYHPRTNGRPTTEVVGYSVDVVREIFNKAGIQFRITMLPWARCQKEVEQGTPFQMALNASYNDQRARTYHLTRPYYQTTNYYFYSHRHHPGGLAISGVNDLKKYRVCGLFGYNYETYGLPAGSIDQGARDFTAVIAKLHAGRCDLFVEKYEIMAGFTAIGQSYLADPSLGAAPVPGMAPTAFYMLVSRQLPHALELVKTLNDGLADMEANGQLDRLRKKYIP